MSYALELIGINGKNKSNYFIGTGKPITLSRFFKIFEQKIKDDKLMIEKVFITDETRNLFDVKKIFDETGFKSEIDTFDIIHNRSLNCKKQ